MTEIAKIEAKGFQDLCKRYGQLEAENEQLKEDNETFFETNELLIKEIRELKERCSLLSETNIKLESEIADMKFTRKYLTASDAGKTFARELLGGA